MKQMTKYIFFVACFSIFAVSAVNYTVASNDAFDISDEVPPPPTPGPEPTSIPETNEGARPITTQEEALNQAILLDQAWTTRENPLTLEDLANDNLSFVVEKYDTRQEASDLYGFGTLTDETRASEPVWVVVIKGEVVVNTLKGPVETDGITFIISQETGYMLSKGAAAISNQER